MGTWGRGPFENDAAADFVVELKQSAAPELDVACVLDDVRTAPRDEYLELDEGQRCVAACALVAFAFNAGAVPQTLEGLVAALQRDESLIDLALAALPRVLDRKHSELADVVVDLGRFDALYDQLADLAEGDGPPELIDLSEVLAGPVPEAQAGQRTEQPWSTRAPDVQRIVESSAAVQAMTVAYGAAWTLVGAGVLNVYAELSPADLERLVTHRVVQVQLARRFRVSRETEAVLDAVFARFPAAALRLVLNGFGAWDDLGVLGRLPHLRVVVAEGRAPYLTETAAQVLARFAQLSRVIVEGEEAARR